MDVGQWSIPHHKLPPTGKQRGREKNMDPETAMYIWVGVAILGLILVLMGIAKKGPVKNPVALIGVGAVMLIVGGIWGIAPAIQDAQPLQSQQITVTTQPTEIAAPAFTIDPTAITAVANVVRGAPTPISTAVLNAAETVYTVPVTVNTGGTHDTFAVNYTALNFTVTPIPPVGSNADDLATIYFESEYDMKYENEYILRHSGNQDVFFANWTTGHTNGATLYSWDHSGQDTMLLTDTNDYQIVYGLDGTPADFPDVFKTVGETASWTITFHNADWSWSKVYTVNLIVVVSA